MFIFLLSVKLINQACKKKKKKGNRKTIKISLQISQTKYKFTTVPVSRPPTNN